MLHKSKMRCGKSSHQKMMKPNKILQSIYTMTLGIDQSDSVNCAFSFLNYLIFLLEKTETVWEVWGWYIPNILALQYGSSPQLGREWTAMQIESAGSMWSRVEKSYMAKSMVKSITKTNINLIVNPGGQMPYLAEALILTDTSN